MATIVCSAETVKRAAQTVMTKIIDTRDEHDEETIARVMAKPRKFFWSRRPNPYTREEAILYLNKQDIWGWRSHYGSEEFTHAEKLMLVAEHGDPVTLDQNDVKILFG